MPQNYVPIFIFMAFVGVLLPLTLLAAKLVRPDDVETIFLFPWAVKFKAFGIFGLVEMLIFLGILIVGYIWIWKKGALEWV